MGTGGDDLIDTSYDGDPDGDFVDAGDNIFPGNDPDDDIIYGYDGDDTIQGGNGEDTIYGGDGSDSIEGGDNHDIIYGDNETPDASALPDLGYPGLYPADSDPDNNRDYILGGDGADTIYGADDDDTLYGDAGNDYLDGQIDDDVLSGGNDDDTLIGGAGNDTLTGGSGIDVIDGGADRDVIYGINPGEHVSGGSAGDDWDTLHLTGGNSRVGTTTVDSDGNGFDGTIEYLDTDGNVIGTSTFENIEEIVPCFTPGTVIATPQGARLVQDLKVGDKVITRDNGIQEIRWVGAKQLTGVELARNPHLKPILIKAGSLGNGLPERDMMVSPNHRMLVNNDKAALFFEEREVLAAAKHLVGMEGIHNVNVMGTTYIHFMFDRHEVVLSDGAWTESFQPGDYTLNGIGDEQRQEILELFPELATAAGINGYQAARRSLKGYEARLLVNG